MAASSPAAALCPDFGLPDGSEIAELQTNQGSICIELLRSAAPITVDNFVGYILRGDYDGTIIHRSAPGFVIQGGAFQTTPDSLALLATQAPILNEPCTIEPGDTVCAERGNVRGTVAMARLVGQVDSATSQYFINLEDNRNPLDINDEGFTVFGHVLGTGMDVVDDIASLPIVPQDEGWFLAPQVGIGLGELPVQASVPFFPTPFGCWDPTDLAVVVDPSFDLSGLPDPVFGTGLFPLSGGCGTKIARGTFIADPGPASCPAQDLLTTGVTGIRSLSIRFDPETADFLQYEFSCEQATEALTQRALWRSDYGARLQPELVVVEAAVYQTVPEPRAALMIATGCLLLLGLGRARKPRLAGAR